MTTQMVIIKRAKNPHFFNHVTPKALISKTYALSASLMVQSKSTKKYFNYIRMSYLSGVMKTEKLVYPLYIM